MDDPSIYSFSGPNRDKQLLRMIAAVWLGGYGPPTLQLVCLPLSNFQLFSPLKEYLAGKRYATNPNVKQAVTSWLQTLDTVFFYARIKPWLHVEAKV